MMPYARINQHAHDIAFAVFRVSALVKHQKLKTELEGAAIELITQFDAFRLEKEIDRKNDQHLFHYHERLKWLVRLGESVGEVRDVNAKVLCREIDNLQTAIIKVIGNIIEEDIDLEGEAFDALEKLLVSETTEKKQTKKRERIDETVSSNETEETKEAEEKEDAEDVIEAVSVVGSGKEEKKPENAGTQGKTERKTIIQEIRKQTEKKLTANKKENISELTPEERQQYVLKTIRQMPNGCRMRELVTMFPDVSERTLRNDLQILVKGRSVERFGSQGPYSYFRAVTKEEVFAL
jgi:hypothetical protein